MNLYRYLKGVGVASALCLGLMLPGRASALVIDDFQHAFSLSTTAVAPVTVSTTIGPFSDIIGKVGVDGDLDVQLDKTVGIDGIETSVKVLGGDLGVVRFSAASGGTANLLLQWDGQDVSTALDASGLATAGVGRDLTIGSVTGFGIDVISQDLPASFSYRVYSDSTNWSFLTKTIPPPPVPLPGGGASLVFNFAAFGIGGGAGADFSNVGALELFIAGSDDLDLRLGTVATTLVPEPATMAFLGLGVLPLLRRRRKAA